MIDWFHLLTNALWILACALALAAISYASWQASSQQKRLREILNGTGYQLLFNLAGLLFCLGLAGSDTQVWKIILWLVLAAAFGMFSIASACLVFSASKADQRK